MANVGDEKVGTPAEFELRDDDRPTDSPYRRGRGTGMVGILIVGLVVAGALLVYVARDRLPGMAATPPAVTGTR